MFEQKWFVFIYLYVVHRKNVISVEADLLTILLHTTDFNCLTHGVNMDKQLLFLERYILNVASIDIQWSLDKSTPLKSIEKHFYTYHEFIESGIDVIHNFTLTMPFEYDAFKCV